MSSFKLLSFGLMTLSSRTHLSAANTVPDGITPELRQKIVDEHNRIRRTVSGANMVKLQYDEKLECVAQKYVARSGEFKVHNKNSEADYAACGGNGTVGENWFSGPLGDAAYAWVDMKWDPYNEPSGCSERESWMAQKKDDKATLNSTEYDRAITDCPSADKFGKWGHYTQVMWAETTHVGCWYTQTFGTLCNYSPAGNVYNWTGVMLPYVTYGTPCSACPQSHKFCDAGLCSATEPGADSSNKAADSRSSAPSPPVPGVNIIFALSAGILNYVL